MVGGLISLIILVLTLLFLLDFYSEKYDAEASEKVQPISDSAVDESKVLRSQEEISEEYRQNIGELLETLQIMEGSSEEIFSKAEAGFFDILVPTDLRDLHIQTLLKIQKMEDEEMFVDKEALRNRLIPLLITLLKAINSDQ